MDLKSLRRFRRLEKDMLRTEKAYVHDLMEVMDFKGEADVAAMEEKQKGFEDAIKEFKVALYGDENKGWKAPGDSPRSFFNVLTPS